MYYVNVATLPLTADFVKMAIYLHLTFTDFIILLANIEYLLCVKHCYRLANVGVSWHIFYEF